MDNICSDFFLLRVISYQCSSSLSYTQYTACVYSLSLVGVATGLIYMLLFLSIAIFAHCDSEINIRVLYSADFVTDRWPVSSVG